MIIMVLIMIAILAAGLLCVALELVSLKRKLKQQQIEQQRIILEYSPKYEPLRRGANRLSSIMRLSCMPDAADALYREFERLRAGSDFVDLSKIGEWFANSGYRAEYAKLGHKKLSNWIDTLDGWEIRRNHEGYPAVLMRKEGK